VVVFGKGVNGSGNVKTQRQRQRQNIFSFIAAGAL